MDGRFRERLETLNRCKTADEVADLLQKHGVKGQRNECDTCPIARFLGDVLDDEIVEIDRDRVTMYFMPDYELKQYDLEAGPQAFIKHFDEGRYYELEE